VHIIKNKLFKILFNKLIVFNINLNEMTRILQVLILLFFLYGCEDLYDVDLNTYGEQYNYDGEIIIGEPSITKSTLDTAKVIFEIDNIPNEYEISIEAFASFLTGFNSEAEIAFATFYWMSKKIEYDYEDDDTWENQESEVVFGDKKAVCTGYSQLYANLTRKAGLENTVRVFGWAKGTGWEDSDINNDENHAWNAVQIDNKWFLIDVTWASNWYQGCKNIKSAYDIFFLAVSEDFINSHYPNDNRWQLLENPYSESDFLNFNKKFLHFNLPVKK